MTPEEEAAYDAELDRRIAEQEAAASCKYCLDGGRGGKGCPKCGRKQKGGRRLRPRRNDPH